MYYLMLKIFYMLNKNEVGIINVKFQFINMFFDIFMILQLFKINYLIINNFFFI